MIMEQDVTAKLDPRKERLHIIINEEVTSTQVPELRQRFKQILDDYELDNWKALYLDMRNTRVVDSMGVNWLYAESLRLKEDNKTFVVRISSPAINRVFAFAGLDKIVTLKYRRRKQTR